MAFEDWIHERNTSSADRCPQDILKTDVTVLLAKWLSLFVIEVCKKDGTEYLPATIHFLLISCGLQRIMRHNNDHQFDIFNKKDV